MAVWICLATAGCSPAGLQDYANDWLYPQDISSVYVEMFDSRSLRRGYEYVLTDAIAKQIEARTPYKIVSDPDKADTMLSGQISSIGSAVIAGERFTGRALEKEATISVSVSWKNLKTGGLLINNEIVSASASFSELLDRNPTQDFDYAATVAANRAAEKIIELMQKKW